MSDVLIVDANWDLVTRYGRAFREKFLFNDFQHRTGRGLTPFITWWARKPSSLRSTSLSMRRMSGTCPEWDMVIMIPSPGLKTNQYGIQMKTCLV